MKKYTPTKFKAKDSVYDKAKADYAVSFIECLCHTKGTWAGKPFTLIDWQEQIIRDIFGIIKPNGYRQFNTAYYWDTGYISKLYLNSSCYLDAFGSSLRVNGTVIGGSDPNMAGKEVKMGGSTSYYITASTSRELKPSSSSTSYPFYLGTASLYWHYAYLGSVQIKIGSGTSSKIGFFAGTPIARQTLSTYSQNMSYSAATASNYLKILNNLVGILVKYGLIGT